jgi:hypothetical protein
LGGAAPQWLGSQLQQQFTNEHHYPFNALGLLLWFCLHGWCWVLSKVAGFCICKHATHTTQLLNKFQNSTLVAAHHNQPDFNQSQQLGAPAVGGATTGHCMPLPFGKIKPCLTASARPAASRPCHEVLRTCFCCCCCCCCCSACSGQLAATARGLKAPGFCAAAAATSSPVAVRPRHACTGCSCNPSCLCSCHCCCCCSHHPGGPSCLPIQARRTSHSLHHT